MFLQIQNLMTLVKLFLLEQVRVPLGVFWGMLAPSVLFFFFHIDVINSGSVDVAWYASQCAWFMSYIIASVSLYGFSIYLVGRRESGFLRSFVIGRRDKALFVLAQLVSALVILLVYTAFFLFTTTLVFGINPLVVIPEIAAPYAVVTLMFMSGSIIFLLIPMNFQNANTVVSISFMLMVMLSLAGVRSEGYRLNKLNIFNPMHIGEKLIDQSLSLNPLLLLAMFVFVLFNAALVLNLKTNPVWEGQ